MVSPRIVLFLDIDEVLSIYSPSEEALTRFERFGLGLPAWPVPLALPLLRAVSQDNRFHPVWLSSWGHYAVLWNDRAGTRHFPVAYPLTRRQVGYARRLFPHLVNQEAPYRDGFSKALALCYYLRNAPGHPAIWMEDGCEQEAKELVLPQHLRLVDTLKEPLLSYLLANHSDLEAAAQRLISTYFLSYSVTA